MQLIGVIDTKHNRWKREKNRTRGEESYSKSVRDKWFPRAFKLGFCLINMSRLFKSNLVLAL